MEKAIDDEYEMSKPLARYADDKDLDKMLKERTREGDPMMLFLKKSKNGKERTANAPSFKSKKLNLFKLFIHITKSIYEG